MKTIYLSVLFLACGVLLLPAQTSPAQTNTGTNAVGAILALVTTNPAPASLSAKPPAAPKQARGPIIIKAVGPAVFDMNEHWAIYQDRVRVTDPQMKLTCEWVKAILPPAGENLTNIVAETNVVMDFTNAQGEHVRATGDKAVYFLHVQNGITNETVTLTGNPPVVESGQSTMTGSAIIWDRVTDKYYVTEPTGVFSQDTNAPAGTKTNQSAQPKLF